MAVIRLAGFFTSSFRMKSFACSETMPKVRSGKLYCPLRTRARISPWVGAAKGGVPDTSMYAMTPMDHMSHLSVYAPRSTSGAT